MKLWKNSQILNSEPGYPVEQALYPLKQGQPDTDRDELKHSLYLDWLNIFR
jgi:hypothetical protein